MVYWQQKMKMTLSFTQYHKTPFAHQIFIDPQCAEHSTLEWFLPLFLTANLETGLEMNSY